GAGPERRSPGPAPDHPPHRAGGQNGARDQWRTPMAGTSQPPLVPAEVTPPPAAGEHRGVVHDRRVRRLSGRDRIVVGLMVLVPLVLTIGLVWLPAIATVLLSFT